MTIRKHGSGVAQTTTERDGAHSSDISRRGLFKQVGAASAVALAAPGLSSATAQEHSPSEHGATSVSQLEAHETLTATEADILEAIVARLIPADQNGPGALEAGAAYFIDRALAGPLRSSRQAYADGLAAVETYARSNKGAAFAQLAAPDQDAILTDFEKNVPGELFPDAASFFNLVRTHTIQGTFCDPYYGGNSNFVGWGLIGYPGIRMTVGEAEQRLKAPEPVRKSAYNDGMFTLKGGEHGH
jgi:gluconate 2-dehydrogenase gamma chain